MPVVTPVCHGGVNADLVDGVQERDDKVVGAVAVGWVLGSLAGSVGGVE